ncbi:hypothetical protein LCGC14_3132150, partial [marine sediment metagenome]
MTTLQEAVEQITEALQRGWDHKVYVILTALLAEKEREIVKLKAELDGDGSASSDPLKSLGLRTCLELQKDNIALLVRDTEQAEAVVVQMRKALHI